MGYSEFISKKNEAQPELISACSIHKRKDPNNFNFQVYLDLKILFYSIVFWPVNNFNKMKGIC